jgi:hypothetical protein
MHDLLRSIAGNQYRRIAIVGMPGAGKTTLARELSRHLELPHVELTQLRWQPGWIRVDDAVLRSRVAAALQGDGWIAEGTYRLFRFVDPQGPALIIWLDYSRRVLLARLLRRTVRRLLRGEEFSPGNYEHAGRLVSLPFRVLREHSRFRRDFARLLEQAEYAGIELHRVCRPEHLAGWVTRDAPSPPR